MISSPGTDRYLRFKEGDIIAKAFGCDGLGVTIQRSNRRYNREILVNLNSGFS